MTDNMPRMGDTVRVVLEGVVTFADSELFDVADSNTIDPRTDHVKSIEVLTPPVRVSDKVMVCFVNDALPVGTVVTIGDNVHALVKFEDGRWHDPATGRSYAADTMGAERTVVYLPGSK
jgi:hypothetical protein